MIKKLMRNKLLLGIIIGISLTSTVVYAAYVQASEISFTSSTGLKSTNVQSALEELNSKCSAKGEGDITPEPEKVYKCKRATTLHTEICNSRLTEDRACRRYGEYNVGDTITYGTLGTKGTLTTGDAFDCDVNGDGQYNSNTERFYYVSGLDGNDNNDTKVLIYYSNIDGANPSSTATSKYGGSIPNSSTENWHGPLDAVKLLPTISQWSNVELLSVDNNYARIINSFNYEEPLEGDELYVKRGLQLIDNPFVYKDSNGEKYAARLLSAKEMYNSCTNDLRNCKFLLENTRYSSSDIDPYYWLENPTFVGTYNSIVIMGEILGINTATVSNHAGVRPVIEVLKTDIDY